MHPLPTSLLRSPRPRRPQTLHHRSVVDHLHKIVYVPAKRHERPSTCMRNCNHHRRAEYSQSCHQVLWRARFRKIRQRRRKMPYFECFSPMRIQQSGDPTRPSPTTLEIRASVSSSFSASGEDGTNNPFCDGRGFAGSIRKRTFIPERPADATSNPVAAASETLPNQALAPADESSAETFHW